MATNKNFIHTLRNVLVILSTVLMIAVLALQYLEVKEYGIGPYMWNTIKSMFQPEPAPAVPAAPATAKTPAGN